MRFDISIAFVSISPLGTSVRNTYWLLYPKGRDHILTPTLHNGNKLCRLPNAIAAVFDRSIHPIPYDPKSVWPLSKPKFKSANIIHPNLYTLFHPELFNLQTKTPKHAADLFAQIGQCRKNKQENKGSRVALRRQV